MAEEMAKGEERDLLEEAKEAFELALEVEDDNRKEAADDLRFALLEDQWPEKIRKQREIEGRPVLTVPLLRPYIRQVVNDARQNKPSIKVHPADSGADVETADIMNGLIRNIEYTSNAEIAYDTATECAVSMGWGYFKIDYDYAHDDTFDLDLKIERVSDPFSIYGDPNSRAADSSDWNTAFDVEWMKIDDYKDQFPEAEDPSDWFGAEHSNHWLREKEVLLAKWWRREEAKRKVLLLSDGTILDEEEAFAEVEIAEGIRGARLDYIMATEPGLTVKAERETRSWKVKRHLMSGGEVLKSEDWLGKYIPIVPVYGDDIMDDTGKRHLRSLIRGAKDAQRMFNYWRTTSTELVALAPRVPFIGPKGSFKSDSRRWSTANTQSHAYLEYDVVTGATPPQRQPLDTGTAAGALQEAMNAAKDIQSIIGVYDPALGAPSNEVSGRAILARQKEADVSTFHFQDNMSRAIRHAGRILIDLIPKIYTGERVVRIMGEDGVPSNQPLGKPVPIMGPDGKPQMQPVIGPNGQPMMNAGGRPLMQQATRIFDLATGKYDLTVTTGPSYTTKREEAAVQMVEMIRAYPQAMPIMGDLLVKNLDWPGADELAKRLKMMLPPQLNGGLPPEVEQMIEQGKQQLAAQGQVIEQLQAYINKLEADATTDQQKVAVSQFDAETKRIKTLSDIQANGTNVPDAGAGQYADYEGIVAAAEANRLNAMAEKERANAGLATAKTMRELMPQPQVQQPQQGGFQR